jgi:hypothetical protein
LTSMMWPQAEARSAGPHSMRTSKYEAFLLLCVGGATTNNRQTKYYSFLDDSQIRPGIGVRCGSGVGAIQPTHKGPLIIERPFHVWRFVPAVLAAPWWRLPTPPPYLSFSEARARVITVSLARVMLTMSVSVPFGRWTRHIPGYLPSRMTLALPLWPRTAPGLSTGRVSR